MKKKISVMLCMLAMMLIFTGCSSNQKETLEYEEASIEQVTEFLIGYCAESDEAAIEQWKSMSDFALEQQLTDAGLPVTPKSFLGTLEAWQAAGKECGSYQGHEDYEFETSRTELTVSTEAKFDNRNGKITFIFDENMYLKSMTVDAEYSKGEILEKAGLNTLLGMGTVFAVLIFISLLISSFRFIPKLQNAFAKKPTSETEEAEEAEVQNETMTDDSELIAVIAAAIAAAEGTTTDGFVVRSIKRRSANGWRR